MQLMQKNASKLRSGKLSNATRILGQNTALQKVIIFSYSLLESKHTGILEYFNIKE